MENYNAKLLDSKRRRFPTNTLVGAEEVLARLYHEHTKSKLYTPQTSERSCQAGLTRPGRQKGTRWRSCGQPAPPAGSMLLVASSEPDWTPRSMMAVMEGADAAKWAFILVGVGTEEDVEQYVEWYKAKARSRPDALQQVHDYWYACAWRIALAMRLGTSFGEVTRDIMADVTAFQEAVLAPASRPKQSIKGGRHNVRNDTAETSERPPRKGDKGKSKGKGKGNAWKKRQWHDHTNDQGWRRQPWSWQ